LAQCRRREAKRVEPELLDLPLAPEMVGEEVAVDPHLVVRDREVPAQEVGEEAQDLRIRVGQEHGVSRLASLGPVEHATRGEQRVAATCEEPSFLLIPGSDCPVVRAHPPSTCQLPRMAPVPRSEECTLL
jgi:hypothetical protein